LQNVINEMKKFIVFIAVVLWTSLSLAQSVTVNAQIDSLQILIGEQTGITLEVSADADKPIVMPVITDTLVKGVELIEAIKPDSELINDGKRLLIKQKYIVTSFDSALYYLPPMEVKVGDETYKSNPLALKVYSFPVDTLHPDQFFGPKDILKPDFVLSDWYLTIACIVFFIPLLLLMIYLIKRFRDDKPIIRKIKVEPKLPAHQVALHEIERIKDEKSWQHGKEKEYYTQLTEAIRNYIESRFGFNAMEMTSTEIIEKLMEVKDRQALSELTSLFETADLVKFAKHIPMMNENDANLLNAMNFINETKEEEDPNAKKEPTEITIIEKRPLKTKLILGGSILLIVIVLVLSVIYVITELYSYFG